MDKNSNNITEGMFSTIDQIRQDSKDVRDFVKNVFADREFKKMSKDKEFIKYLKSIYEGTMIDEESVYISTRNDNGTITTHIKEEKGLHEAKVETERYFGKKGIIIMIRDGNKMISAIFKDKKNADKFNRNNPADVKKLIQLANKSKFPKAIDESVNEELSQSEIDKLKKIEKELQNASDIHKAQSDALAKGSKMHSAQADTISKLYEKLYEKLADGSVNEAFLVAYGKREGNKSIKPAFAAYADKKMAQKFMADMKKDGYKVMMTQKKIRGVDESVNEASMDWEKNFKWANDKELKVISKFIFMNDKGIDGVIKMSKHKPFAFRRTIQKMAKKGLHEGKKRYNQKDGVGKSKYVISYHDGKKKHKDGSDFFDIQIFRNKKDLAKFVNTLHKGGYVYGFNESINERINPKFYDARVQYTDPKNKKKFVGDVVRYDNGEYKVNLGKDGRFEKYILAKEKDLKIVSKSKKKTFESVNEGKYYITRNQGRGRGKSLVGGYDLKKKKNLPPKEFRTYKDAEKEVKRLQNTQKGIPGGGSAYFVTDKKMNPLKESINEILVIVDKFDKRKQDYGKVYYQDGGKRPGDGDINKAKKELAKLSKKHKGLTLISVGRNSKMYDVMDESVNEASKEAMGIAGFTGTRGVAVDDFIKKNKIDARKLFNFVRKGNLRDRMDFVTAIAGKPNNKFFKSIVGRFGEGKDDGVPQGYNPMVESKTKESKVVQMIYKYEKKEKKFYDKMAEHERRIGPREYGKFIINALRGFGINPREFKRVPDAEEKLYQTVSKK